MSKKDKEPTFFPDKWLKQLPTGFTDEADAMSQEELKALIVKSESNIYVIDQEKENDDKLNAAKELVKDITAPYRDAIKAQTAKVKYALFLLEGKGVDLDNRE